MLWWAIEKESVSNQFDIETLAIQSPLWKKIEFAVYFKNICSQFIQNNCSQVEIRGGQLLKGLIGGQII